MGPGIRLLAMQEHFVLKTSFSPLGNMGDSGLVGHVPVASKPGHLGPGCEVALSIQVAQI